MSKALEELSKDLARGISRRTAFKRFFATLGGLGAAMVTGRRAAAQGNSVCVRLCREQGLKGRELGACVSASAHCPPGECALVTNGGDSICISVEPPPPPPPPP